MKTRAVVINRVVVLTTLISFFHATDDLKKMLSLQVSNIPKGFRILAKITAKVVDFEARVSSQCPESCRQVLDSFFEFTRLEISQEVLNQKHK